MDLNELASACKLYEEKTNFDISYLEFLNSINDSLDLNKTKHRKSLLIWLNRWACRQFKIDFHDFASDHIFKCYKILKALLPEKTKTIWELDEDNFDRISMLYDALANRPVSKIYRNGKEIIKHAGPTGASKILFALRPKSLIPWDEAMRDDFGKGVKGFGYTNYIKNSNLIIKGLENQCNRNGFEINELPKKIGRIHSTIPKIIDEYNWVKITKGWTIPKTKRIFK